MEVVHQKLALRNLPASFSRMRIVLAGDFHCSRTVSARYLQRCVQRINSLDPDIILLTGDYITHDYRGRFSKKIARLLPQLRAKHGIYATLGNHDYGIGGGIKVKRKNSLSEMIETFENGGIRVLQNSAESLQVDNHKLWFVGIGDLWAGDFQPERAFADVDYPGTVIAITHNPEAVGHLSNFDFDALVAGHTHGTGFEWTALPDRPFLNRRRYTSGMYELDDRLLYVNRGLGRHGRLFNTRPEITVFTLC